MSHELVLVLGQLPLPDPDSLCLPDRYSRYCKYVIDLPREIESTEGGSTEETTSLSRHVEFIHISPGLDSIVVPDWTRNEVEWFSNSTDRVRSYK